MRYIAVMTDEPLELLELRDLGLMETRRNAREDFKYLEQIGDVFAPLAESVPAEFRHSAEPARNPWKMYHPGGRFLERTGARFDYLFSELPGDPSGPMT